ncbi:MAG: hypothetical protein H6905_04495 [Hyphomicrobiales bacterium]|nr:hypothetical protein [Hyphomicrobiales bacterium]
MPPSRVLPQGDLTVCETRLGGVPVFDITPAVRECGTYEILLEMHGGGLILCGQRGGTSNVDTHGPALLTARPQYRLQRGAQSSVPCGA